MAISVKRMYGGFRGVDFRGNDINLLRSPDSVNMWKDYRETESIRTRPKLRPYIDTDGVVYGIFFFTVGGNKLCLIHCDDTLYKVLKGAKSVLFKGLNKNRSDAFVYAGHWYFKDGKHYLVYDGSTIKNVEGYVPTTTIGRKPIGGGTEYEDINLLSDKRTNSFLADGVSKEYYLDSQNIDGDFFPEVKVNDKSVSGYTVDFEAGKIVFSSAPSAPLTDGQDNVFITFKKTVSGNRNLIEECTMLQVFDNRVFFSGNPNHPNVIWHSSLDDPAYCSDLDRYNEGLDTIPVKGLVAGNNALWVFREPSQSNTTIFYHTPITDKDYGKIYPNVHSSISAGCVGKTINFNDDIVFFSDRGMEGISGDITTEQVVAHRSTLVDRKLISEPDYASMELVEWDGYLVCLIGNKAYLADSRAVFTNENHFEYEWFYWEFDTRIHSAKVDVDTLYVGTDNGVYTLSDNASPVKSYWVTPKDKFGYPQMLKTTNKRGCVVEATGDVIVSAKTEKTEFETVEAFENIGDYFSARIKRKKFKDIQLKFETDTRFSLESATLECFVGGYIKR